MLIFSPTYDHETLLCTRLAEVISKALASKILSGKAANRQDLFVELNQGAHEKVVFLGHGSRESIAESAKSNALVANDFSSGMPIQAVFAYSCHSAVLGRDAALNSWLWWGYDNVMMPPPFDSVKKKYIVDVFRLAILYVNSGDNEMKIQDSIEGIKSACDKVARKYEKGGINVSLSESMFFRHMWSRLRIWMPESTHPISHPDAFGGQLDFS